MAFSQWKDGAQGLNLPAFKIFDRLIDEGLHLPSVLQDLFIRDVLVPLEDRGPVRWRHKVGGVATDFIDVFVRRLREGSFFDPVRSLDAEEDDLLVGWKILLVEPEDSDVFKVLADLRLVISDDKFRDDEDKDFSGAEPLHAVLEEVQLLSFSIRRMVVGWV